MMLYSVKKIPLMITSRQGNRYHSENWSVPSHACLFGTVLWWVRGCEVEFSVLCLGCHRCAVNYSPCSPCMGVTSLSLYSYVKGQHRVLKLWRAGESDKLLAPCLGHWWEDKVPYFPPCLAVLSLVILEVTELQSLLADIYSIRISYWTNKHAHEPMCH